jgi:hypothetical protein
MTILNALLTANQSKNQGRREQQALPKDGQCTISGMSPKQV